MSVGSAQHKQVCFFTEGRQGLSLRVTQVLASVSLQKFFVESRFIIVHVGAGDLPQNVVAQAIQGSKVSLESFGHPFKRRRHAGLDSRYQHFIFVVGFGKLNLHWSVSLSLFNLAGFYHV